MNPIKALLFACLLIVSLTLPLRATSQVREVIVVIKTHFDITYTNLVTNILTPYAEKQSDDMWSLDAAGLGGNDFSSTKVGVHEALLADRSSRLCVISDAHQSVRAFRVGERTGLLIAGFHTGGGDGFFATHFAAERRPLQVGSPLSDTTMLQLSGRETGHIYALPKGD